MLIATIAVPLLLAAWYSWTSKINQFFFFGKTVPAGFAATAEARSITARYRLQTGLGCLLALAAGLLLYVHYPSTAVLWALLIQALAFTLAFAQAHRAAARTAPPVLPSGTVEVPLAAAVRNPPSVPALLAPLAAALLVLLVAMAMVAKSSLLHAPQALGALVAAHGGGSLFSFGTGMALAGLAALLIRTKARSRTPLGYNALWASMIGTWAAVAIMTVPIIVAFAGGAISRAESKLVIAAVALLALAVVVFRMLTNRSFFPPPAEMQDDAGWRWGLFYSNRKDPALFVQTRCGAGFTLNYGRVMAWPISAAFVAVLVVILFTAGHR